MSQSLRIPVASEESLPVCPRCERELDAVLDLRSSSPRTDFSQVLHLLACPGCRTVLGASLNSEIK